MSERETAAILELEGSRCAALCDEDRRKIASLLTGDYLHVHTHGVVHTRDEYLAFLDQIDVRSCERDALTLRVYGNVAVACGAQVMVLRPAGAPGFLRVPSFVTQVWVHDGDSWRQASFQATGTGPPTDIE